MLTNWRQHGMNTSPRLIKILRDKYHENLA
jgi:hypothetical protein